MLRGKIAGLSPFSESDGEVLFSWINDRELVLSNASFHTVHQVAHLEWFRAIQKRTDVAIFGIRRLVDTGIASITDVFLRRGSACSSGMATLSHCMPLSLTRPTQSAQSGSSLPNVVSGASESLTRNYPAPTCARHMK